MTSPPAGAYKPHSAGHRLASSWQHMGKGRSSFVLGTVVALALAAIASPIQVGAQAASMSAPTVAGSIQRGFIDISGSPGVPALNPKTGTLYVPVHMPHGLLHDDTAEPRDGRDQRSYVQRDGHLGVFRGRASEGWRTARRRRPSTNRTDTVYTANATGTVSVVDGALCNVAVTSGCDAPLATIHTGGFLVDDVFNPRTRTLYVARSTPATSL